MGYRIWSAFQTIFLFLAAWIQIDSGLVAGNASFNLWIAKWLNSLGTPWFSATTAVGWLILVIALLQLIKSIVVVVRKEY